MKTIRRRADGFTMIEMIVALTCMAIFAAAIISTFWSLQALNRRSRNLTIATQLVQRQMEVYRNTPYSSINVGTDDHAAKLTPYPALTTPRSFTATITEPTVGSLKQVNLNLTYSDKGRTKSIQVSTYVASRGLNR